MQNIREEKFNKSIDWIEKKVDRADPADLALLFIVLVVLVEASTRLLVSSATAVDVWQLASTNYVLLVR